jgi:metacaspase-1
MAEGRMINIGLNAVDPDHYGGWDGKLNACEADAKDMSHIGDDQGFEGETLLTTEATADNIFSAIRGAAEDLGKGDILFLTYSGHGGQVKDKHKEEEDAKDETWCAFDRQIVDDELFALWGEFDAGVRIFVLSDSCHSGTVVKTTLYDEVLIPEEVNRGMVDVEEPQTKAMPLDTEEETYKRNQDLYDELQEKYPQGEDVDVDATVILISGCEDNQLSLDGNKNGLFTATLLKVWNDGNFKGTYRKFRRDILAKMPPSQSPNFFTVGPQNRQFERQRPLTI